MGRTELGHVAALHSKWILERKFVLSLLSFKLVFQNRLSIYKVKDIIVGIFKNG